jgi:hypothetical protein
MLFIPDHPPFSFCTTFFQLFAKQPRFKVHKSILYLGNLVLHSNSSALFYVAPPHPPAITPPPPSYFPKTPIAALSHNTHKQIFQNHCYIFIYANISSYSLKRKGRKINNLATCHANCVYKSIPYA